MENEKWQEDANEKRPQRPRFTRVERAYSANGNSGEHAFRPQGFESHATNGEHQGSYNTPRQGGYNRQGNGQGGYNNNRQGGYNNNRQGGFNNRQGNGQGGYNNNRQGGYNNNRQGGYNNNRQGGYNNNRQGGYNKQRQGGGQGLFRQRSADYNPNAKYSLKKQIEYKEYLDDPNAPIRLNKFLANAGVCSRREADEFREESLCVAEQTKGLCHNSR